ncbi:cell division protein CrgA [Nocardioides alcanivorans]|uniref:cell division protein CrgA n=1 Tax=Nocardioides alcanivorans TaxID=2897352 RepID=UPI001F375BDC|nr:cell division protein CrgA [Nocardioides alcanivorans]
MAKDKDEIDLLDVKTGPVLSARFIVSLLLIAVGIAYVVLWTLYTREMRLEGTDPDTLIPGMKKLDDWNWAIGFGLAFIGLALSAHPKTPLGRGRGVVVGMLGCFLIGLLWICTFYVFADNSHDLWLLTDLGQLNLVVGIGFMAVGFTFATRWE